MTANRAWVARLITFRELQVDAKCKFNRIISNKKLPVFHAASGSRVGCITLSVGHVLYLVNRVHVTGLPQELIDPIRQCIISTIGPIQEELDDFGAHDFRFQGNWQKMLNQTKERAKSRKLTLELFKCMLGHGWTFIQATPTMGRAMLQVDTMFFEQSVQAPVQDQNVLNENELFAIGFDNGDRIRIIDAPDGIAPLVREAILKHWDGEAGILNACLAEDGSVEFQLKEGPFRIFCVETSFKVQLLMGQIIVNIKAANYKLYAMVDSVGVHSNSDLATWVFRKVGPSWSS
ncbi:hypothetical protein BG004_001675 [Podila humilis]|nr:hypothetical protein BG004_001675 [Podila humilis]